MITNQNRIQVIDSDFVKVFVVKNVPANANAQNAAAKTPKLKDVPSGFTIKIMPKKPRVTAAARAEVNFSPKKKFTTSSLSFLA